MKNISDEIMTALIEYIALGLYKVNEKLPSVRELSTLYHVNPNTIAKVYASLEEKGYIYALPAKGYYVSETNPVLIDNVKLDMKPLIQKLILLSKIIHLSQSDLIDMLTKEDEKYD